MTQPNNYTLASEHTRITYSSSSISGQPQLHFHDRRDNVTVSGQNVHTEETEIGTLVTATVAVTAISNTRLTLVLPQITLPKDKSSLSIRAVAILTTTQTEGLPPVRQTYNIMRLRGTARLVQF